MIVDTSKSSMQVEQILAASNTTFKTIEVFKEVDPVIDEGHLTLSDLQPIDVKKLILRRNLP